MYPEKGVIHTSDFVTLKMHDFICEFAEVFLHVHKYIDT